MFTPIPMLGDSYDPDAVALFSRMSVQPTTARKKLINNTILSLKSSGTWGELDCLYLFAAHDKQAALLNWISSNYTITETGTKTFTTDVGISGTSSNLSTNFNPSTAVSPNFTQNDACMGFWSETNSAAALFEAYNTSGVYTRFNPRTSSGDNFTMRFNNNNDVTSTGGLATDSSGFFIANRNISTSFSIYRNSSLVVTLTQTAISVPAQPLRFSENSTRVLSAGFYGGYLDNTQRAGLYDALSYYRTGVGL